MNRNLEDLTHEQLADEALFLARSRFRSKILAVLAIDLRAAVDAEEPSADLARDVIGLVDRLYSSEGT